MADSGDLQMELLLLGPGHGLDDGVNGGNHVVQGEGLVVEDHFSALDFGDIQNIVNQTEQVVSRGHNFLGILPHLDGILRLVGQEGGKAQHRVHGRADVVGHVGEKHGLGLAGNLGGPQGLGQLLAVDFPLRLPLRPLALLLPPVPVVQEDAQGKCRQQRGHHNHDMLVDAPALLLDGLQGHIAHQENRPAVHRPHVV